jgi:hypothetical protein
MKTGTKIDLQLIVDDRFTKNCTLETAISAQRTGLKTAIYNTGLELYRIGEERNLTWNDGTKQIRQAVELIMEKSLTKDQVYEVVNTVRSQPLKFSKHPVML